MFLNSKYCVWRSIVVQRPFNESLHVPALTQTHTIVYFVQVCLTYLAATNAEENVCYCPAEAEIHVKILPLQSYSLMFE